MSTYEFQYYLRDTNGSIDEGFLLTEVVSGANKIIAEEVFLDVIKNKDINPSNIYIISAEKVPEEESIEVSDIEEENEIEDSFEYNTNTEEESFEYNEEVDYDL